MERMKHPSYHEELTYHELYEGDDHPVYCHGCCEAISGPAYIRDNRSDHLWSNADVIPLYGLHKSCAELPRQIQHPLHPHHPLTASFRRTDSHGGDFGDRLRDTAYGFICDGCRRYSWGFSYNCGACPFKLDAQCASKLESQQLQMKDRVERGTDFHDHKLEMFYYDMLLPTPFLKDIVCGCCREGFHRSAYACIECRLFMHESCLDKIPHPHQIFSPFHLRHLLRLGRPSIYHRCRACRETIDGLMLTCEELRCEKSFHISCCAHTERSLKLKCHNKHPMFFIKYGYVSWHSSKCVVCNTSCDHCSIYRCVECDVNVHMECIPLPHVVKHECDPVHSLTLTNSLPRKTASNEYRCDLCEKEGDLRHPAYYCEECFYIAHIECVLQLSEEDPPLEILEYLVPRSRVESEKETKDESEQESFGADEEEGQWKNNLEDCSLREMEERQWKNDLENCSLTEIDEIITIIKNKIDKLTSKLEVVQEIRVQKLNSLI